MGNAGATVQPIKYFENVFSHMVKRTIRAPRNGNGGDDSDEWAPFRQILGATTALADIDFFCFSGSEGIPYNCPTNHVSRFWQDQSSSLYAQNSIGMSYYNSGQITLRHPISHGLQLDISYTYRDRSTMVPMRSAGFRSARVTTAAMRLSTSSIINTWKPYLNEGIQTSTPPTC